MEAADILHVLHVRKQLMNHVTEPHCVFKSWPVCVCVCVCVCRDVALHHTERRARLRRKYRTAGGGGLQRTHRVHQTHSRAAHLHRYVFTCVCVCVCVCVCARVCVCVCVDDLCSGETTYFISEDEHKGRSAGLCRRHQLIRAELESN